MCVSALTVQWLTGYIVVNHAPFAKVFLFFFFLSRNSLFVQGNSIFLFVRSVALGFIQNKSPAWKTSAYTTLRKCILCDICFALFVFGSSLQAAVAAVLAAAALLVAPCAHRETHLPLAEAQQESSEAGTDGRARYLWKHTPALLTQCTLHLTAKSAFSIVFFIDFFFYASHQHWNAFCKLCCYVFACLPFHFFLAIHIFSCFSASSLCSILHLPCRTLQAPFTSPILSSASTIVLLAESCLLCSV